MEYSEDFNKAFEFTVGMEGVYSNDLNDPGGETKYGISKRAYPAEDIKNLTLDRAKEIYYKDYWLKMGCDNLRFPFNLYVFDEAVNCGVGFAGVQEKAYPNGVAFLMERIRHYCDLVQKNPALLKYLRGWVLRVVTLYERFPL